MILQLRRDLLKNWNAYNPILRNREVGFIKDLNTVKIGDGVTPFKNLNDSGSFEYIIISDGTTYFHCKVKSDTSQNWKEGNPILLDGEPSFETDTKLNKVGDGKTFYNDLPYIKSPILKPGLRN